MQPLLVATEGPPVLVEGPFVVPLITPTGETKPLPELLRQTLTIWPGCSVTLLGGTATPQQPAPAWTSSLIGGSGYRDAAPQVTVLRGTRNAPILMLLHPIDLDVSETTLLSELG
ncbi:MAG: hypothetical protein KC731_09170 [Myxococcales bacterium]|nr:hypothetical protein [Myxococcales bacterium]